jgi:hypothetical protein
MAYGQTPLPGNSRPFTYINFSSKKSAHRQ